MISIVLSSMYLIPIASCFLASFFNGSMIARAFGQRGAVVIGIVCLIIAFVSSALIWIEVVVMGCPVSLDLWGTWFHVGSFQANWTLNFDMLTAHMLFTVTGVSMAVHMYAADYMRADPHQNLFMSYLSMFTAFMLVLVAADNLMLMLVGWEGKLLHCPNDAYVACSVLIKRGFFTARIPAVNRHGLHTSLFKQVLVGFMLGDGWLEKHGRGVRLCISLIDRFADVAQWYLVLLYGLGYTDRLDLGTPLQRSNRPTAKPYFQLRTFTFASLMPYYDMWYCINAEGKAIKVLPPREVLFELMTPMVLAIWIMGDGSGMRDGGFKISSHSFTREQNQLLCDILMEKYGIHASVLNERNKYTFIRVLKRSTGLLHYLVKPFLLPSCEYKFRHVK